MESEGKEKDEITWMAQAPLGNMAASSWVRRTGRHCKEWFLKPKLCLLSLLFGVLLVMVFVFAVKTQTSHPGKFPPELCPSEWIGYKKKCYFISEEEQNWTSSRTFCAKNESLLAIFENQEEMRSLAKRLKIDDSWIGLRKKGENFYWENGIAFKEDSFQIRNHSECAYLDAFTISTSACSLPRRWIWIPAVTKRAPTGNKLWVKDLALTVTRSKLLNVDLFPRKKQLYKELLRKHNIFLQAALQKAKLRWKLQKQSKGRVRAFMEKEPPSSDMTRSARDPGLANKNGFVLVNTRPQQHF